MAQQLSELCTLLVDDLYGELSSRVFSTLALRGRLSLAALVPQTGLSSNQLKHGLAVLIQQHLAFHYTEETGQSFYEVDWTSTYGLVRSGKIVKHIEDRLGTKAAALVLNLILQGHARVKDLADAYGLQESDDSTDGHAINGNMGSHGTSSRGGRPQTFYELQTILQKLLQADYICRVNESHFKPKADIHNDAVQHVTVYDFPEGVKGKDEKKEFAQNVVKMKRKWKEGDDGYMKPTNARDASRPVKRARTNGYRVNGINSGTDVNGHVPEYFLKGDVVLRINHPKFNVILRNQRLVARAYASLGNPTAQVYEAFLRTLEQLLPACYDEFAEFENVEDEFDAQPAATIADLMNFLDEDINLDMADEEDQDDEDDEDDDDDDDDRDEDRRAPISAANGRFGPVNGHAATPVQQHDRMRKIEKHMKILKEHPDSFVKYVGPRGGGQYKADFRSLTGALIQNELETLITARFGPLATRAVRILQAKGRLDEKQVSTLAMSRPKEIRLVLSALQASGYADVQEVPKDNARQPSRTVFLWFFDRERCRQLVLNDAYKAMSRLVQQVKVQKARFQLSIDKAERSAGNSDKLTSYDQKELSRWKANEEKLLTQLSRQDDLVATLRDFIGPIPR